MFSMVIPSKNVHDLTGSDQLHLNEYDSIEQDILTIITLFRDQTTEVTLPFSDKKFLCNSNKNLISYQCNLSFLALTMTKVTSSMKPNFVKIAHIASCGLCGDRPESFLAFYLTDNCLRFRLQLPQTHQSHATYRHLSNCHQILVVMWYCV